MANIKLGVVVAAISGKVSGNVFATNKSGAYLRKWSKPTNANTQSQRRVRGTMTALASFWRSLTDQERLSWAASAALRPVTNTFGDQVKLSGFGLYMKQNQFGAVLGGAPLRTAPQPLAIANLQIISAVRDFTLLGDH